MSSVGLPVASAGGAGAGEPGRLRPAWAEVDLGAIAHNAAVLARAAAPARLCAVVKAGGYGHGAAPVARAALQGGATHLAVALVEEGRELRRAGIDAPVLILSQPTPEAMDEVISARLTPTLCSDAGLDALVAAAARSPDRAPVRVHVKVDTGMHRVGASPSEAVALAARVVGKPSLELEGIFTHLAVADEPDDPYTATQLELFEGVLDELGAAGIHPVLRHAANSAGTFAHPGARYDLVRCGIALYGLAPSPALSSLGPVAALRPALSLRARVTHVKTLEAGERLSYGLRYRLERRSVIATVPLGYADGVTRSLAAAGASVLVGGRACPMAGTVTMDQLLVDCGAGAEVAVGDEVVLLGTQGGAAIGAWDWARRTGTIAYEVVCGIGERVPRVYRAGASPRAAPGDARR